LHANTLLIFYTRNHVPGRVKPGTRRQVGVDTKISTDPSATQSRPSRAPGASFCTPLTTLLATIRQTRFRCESTAYRRNETLKRPRPFPALGSERNPTNVFIRLFLFFFLFVSGACRPLFARVNVVCRLYYGISAGFGIAYRIIISRHFATEMITYVSTLDCRKMIVVLYYARIFQKHVVYTVL